MSLGAAFMQAWLEQNSGVNPYEVWYYAAEKVTLYSEAGVAKHLFSKGTGVLRCAAEVTTVDQWLRGTSITNIELSSTVTSIAENAFRDCTSLALAHLPDGVTSIGASAFHNCTNLALTTLPDGLSSIGDYAFSGCTNLALTELPDGVTSIGDSAFDSCSGLTALTFRDTPTSISAVAFWNCANLLNIYVPWAEGTVGGAPWGATNATIHYNS